MISNLIYVFLGGGIGSVLRYSLPVALHISAPQAGAFPWPTFAVNVAGSFMIGLFYALSARFQWHPDFRLLLTVGLCGGFTTFSTFGNESLALLRSGHHTTLAAYVLLSVAAGVAAAAIGAAAIPEARPH